MMHLSGKSVLIDCERMKNPYTGLYSYCYHLTKALLERKTDLNFRFYMPLKAAADFQRDSVVEHKTYNKFFFPLKDEFLLWHCTYQNSPYMPNRKSLPVVLTIHDLNFLYDQNKNKLTQKRYLNSIQRNVDRASHIVCISESTLRDVSQFLNVSHKPLSVIYNGCSVDEIPVLTPPRIIPDKTFLFTIGTINEKKNFHVLPCLLRHNNFQLIIAGISQNPNYKKRIVAEARKLGVADRVVFTGPVSENDKQWYYRNCKAFVFPSLSEGFGLPVIEAMHFGASVLLSDKTSLPELGGDLAYYFKSFDPSHMQQTLMYLLEDKEVNDRSEAIKNRASLFTWDLSAEAYIRVYQSLIR